MITLAFKYISESSGRGVGWTHAAEGARLPLGRCRTQEGRSGLAGNYAFL